MYITCLVLCICIYIYIYHTTLCVFRGSSHLYSSHSTFIHQFAHDEGVVGDAGLFKCQLPSTSDKGILVAVCVLSYVSGICLIMAFRVLSYSLGKLCDEDFSSRVCHFSYV